MTLLLKLLVRLSLGLLAALMLGCTAPSLHAQALTAASGGGSYLSIGGGVTAMRTQYGQRTVAGGLVYSESNLTPRLGLEYEGRFLRVGESEQITQSSYLVGVRFAVRDHRMQPYVKVLGGLGRMSFPFAYAKGTYLVIAPGAGIDYALGDRWTARLLDVEYQDWTSFTFGGLHPYGVSSGLRFRVNGIQLFPKNMRHRH